MAICKTEAIVLKTHNFGESSKIVSIFTQKYGKCRVVAKGARRPKSVLRGNLEPITHIYVVFYKKDNRELHTLSQSDIITPFFRLQVDLDRLAYAHAVCELIDRLTPLEVEHQAIFSLILETFQEMETVRSEDLIFLLWFFELHMVSLLGFRPEFGTCVCCKGGVQGDSLGFSLPRGGVLCSTCATKDDEAFVLSQESLAYLRILQRVRIDNVAKNVLPEKALAEIDNLLQAFLKYHTDDLRDIQSLRVLRDLHSRLSAKTLII